jgi:predicted permease
MSILLQDLKYGIRLLVKAPAFTVTAALSLALGIGANTTIFTLVNAVLLNPLPLHEPSRLVSVFTSDRRNAGQFGGFAPLSDLNFRDYRGRNAVFSGLTARIGVPLSLTGGTGEPAQVFGEMVTANFFEVLGARPHLGRGFLPDEDRTPGSHLVTVLSHQLWQNRFGASPAMMGSTVTLNNQSFTVVGVMPEGFKGANAIGAPALWVPYMTYPVVTTGFVRDGINSRRSLLFQVIGRLRPEATLASAASNLEAIARQLETEHPEENGGRGAALLPLDEAAIGPQFRDGIVRAGGLLMVVVGVVLLIACANVANLLLARAATRQKEIAVRLSLGASRLRLIRQLLTEGLVLAVLGAAGGLLFAYWAQDLLWAMRPPFLQAGAIDISPNLRVLAFTMAIALATGVLFGLAPALQASRPNLTEELNERAGAPIGSTGLWSARSLLVSSEVALSLVALVGAGLFLRSLQQAQRIDPGFDASRLAVLTFDLGAQGYNEPRAREFHRTAIERAASVAGVESAALASNLPLLQGGFLRTVFLEGQDASDRRNGRLVDINVVDERYFETMGIGLVRGRLFGREDHASSPRVVLINETMARQFWPEQDAVGKRFRFFGQPALNEVAGVVRDGKYNQIGEAETPFIYQSLTQIYNPALSLVVRAERPEAILGTVRGEIQTLDRSLPLTNVSTMRELIAQALWPPRMAAALLGVFAALSLTLAMVGVYGVMAYSVAQRTRELGIRLALGATRTDVMRLVVGHGLRLTVAGVAGGLLLAFALTRFIATLLFGISATDLVTFAGVPLLLGVAALAASYLPARRATRIDPIVALRYE